MELLHFAVDDRLSLLRFLLTIGNVRTHRLLQIVDIVHEDAIQLIHLRIDVARHRDIDKEHWTIASASKELLGVFGLENEVRRTRRSDDDIGSIASLVQPAELDRLSIKLLRKPDRAVVSPVGDEN